MDQGQRRALKWLCAAVFTVALSYSLYFRIPPAVDARAYDTIGWNIAQGLGYHEYLNVAPERDQAIIRVGPGYEFFLAFFYFIFGHRLVVIWVVQALLLASSALLTLMISREILKDRWSYKAGLVAFLLIGFSPDLITLQGMLMTEMLSVFLVVLAVFLFFKYYNSKEKSVRLVVAMALSFSGVVLVRTPTVLLALPIIWYLARVNWRHLLIFCFFAGVLFIPWTIRNYYQYRIFMPTNAALGYNILTGNHHGSTGEQAGITLDDYIAKYGYVKTNQIATREALKFILRNPLEFLAITLKRISIYFSFARPTGFWFHLHGLSKAVTLASSCFYSIVLFIFGFLGILQYKRFYGEDRKRVLLFLSLLLMMPLSVIGLVVETRYRMPAYPFFAVFAAFGIVGITEKISWKQLAYIAIVLFANTGIDAYRNIARIFDKIYHL